MGVLAVFRPLRIKRGFILRAYQDYDDGDGRGIVWALPTGSTFPEPSQCPPHSDWPKPLDALDDVMEAIEGDGTPWSYLCASVFWSEIREFGAMWHGRKWSTHTILDKNPMKSRRARRECDFDLPSGKPEEWTWVAPEPDDWKPQVVEDGDAITVTFFTYSGLRHETIFRHEDKFRRGSYCFATQRSDVAKGPGGFLF
jgi:hypothetical protein